MNDERMNSLEGKLDSIVDKLESLVRLEERHNSTVSRLDRLESKVDDMSEKVQANTFVSGAVERFAWVIVSALVGVIAFFARGFNA